LNIVCFRYRAPDTDWLNRQIVIDLQESGIVAPSTTILDGRVAIRSAIVNHRTSRTEIDALVEQTIRIGRNLCGRRTELNTEALLAFEASGDAQNQAQRSCVGRPHVAPQLIPESI